MQPYSIPTRTSMIRVPYCTVTSQTRVADENISSNRYWCPYLNTPSLPKIQWLDTVWYPRYCMVSSILVCAPGPYRHLERMFNFSSKLEARLASARPTQPSQHSHAKLRNRVHRRAIAIIIPSSSESSDYAYASSLSYPSRLPWNRRLVTG
ncbi:hypothetical protein L873DRAFT_42162 [Choiromyces venosus 120613-1]|uniref:Uncharacterized protein n=1 Tax=Choiromyces venosus 120613-1 TaxID=1336337 RepID=A0A3N4KDL6_9PEZI|nr:hypothetical protein L873DRAFT_42162 [Choiromyces venosus 120613-1]